MKQGEKSAVIHHASCPRCVPCVMHGSSGPVASPRIMHPQLNTEGRWDNYVSQTWADAFTTNLRLVLSCGKTVPPKKVAGVTCDLSIPPPPPISRNSSYQQCQIFEILRVLKFLGSSYFFSRVVESCRPWYLPWHLQRIHSPLCLPNPFPPILLFAPHHPLCNFSSVHIYGQLSFSWSALCASTAATLSARHPYISRPRLMAYIQRSKAYSFYRRSGKSQRFFLTSLLTGLTQTLKLLPTIAIVCEVPASVQSSTKRNFKLRWEVAFTA